MCRALPVPQYPRTESGMTTCTRTSRSMSSSGVLQLLCPLVCLPQFCPRACPGVPRPEHVRLVASGLHSRLRAYLTPAWYRVQRDRLDPCRDACAARSPASPLTAPTAATMLAQLHRHTRLRAFGVSRHPSALCASLAPPFPRRRAEPSRDHMSYVHACVTCARRCRLHVHG